jgi:hypothetical protein
VRLSERLRDWLKVWLEVPPPPVEKKLSGAMYAEIRAARAELKASVTAREAISASLSAFRKEQVDTANGYVGSMRRICDLQNASNRAAMADYKNTLAEMQSLHQKLDVALAALGFVAVSGDGAAVAPLEARALRTKRILNASFAVREIQVILTRARQTGRSLDMAAIEVVRVRAENKEVNP